MHVKLIVSILWNHFITIYIIYYLNFLKFSFSKKVLFIYYRDSSHQQPRLPIPITMDFSLGVMFGVYVETTHTLLIKSLDGKLAG